MDVLTRETLGMGQNQVEKMLPGTEIDAEVMPQPVALLPGWEPKIPAKFPKWLIPVGIIVGGLILLRR